MQIPIELVALIRLDLLLESIAGVIAFLISHSARKAFHFTGQKRLSDLSTGFLVLSAAMFGRVIGTTYFFVLMPDESAWDMIVVVTIAYGAMKVMAYILFAVSTRPSRGIRVPRESVLLALPALVDPKLDLIAIIILVVVVLQSLLNYSAVRSRYAMFVLLGFSCLLLSHVSGFLAIDAARGYLWSQLLQFIGLILLLVMLLKAGREE
jgi:hypothetical protein